MPGHDTLEKLTISHAGGEIQALFNPKEYTVEQSNVYAEIGIPGLPAPVVQFIRGNSDKLTFDLLVDTTSAAPGSAGRDANPTAEAIQRLARIDGERHAPPVCTFAWGSFSMSGVVESVKRQFVLFDASGVPLRIQMSLSIKRYWPLADQIGGMNPQSPDRTRTVLARERDTLPAIAYRAYGDEAL